MADRKVSEREFIADNTMAGGSMPQGMVTAGNEIPENGGKPKRKVDQTYWSLVKHQYKKNKLAVAALYVVIFLVTMALTADFVANDKPLYCKYKGESYFPVLKEYAVGLGISKWARILFIFAFSCL